MKNSIYTKHVSKKHPGLLPKGKYPINVIATQENNGCAVFIEFAVCEWDKHEDFDVKTELLKWFAPYESKATVIEFTVDEARRILATGGDE